jgi:hypothetical protein
MLENSGRPQVNPRQLFIANMDEWETLDALMTEGMLGAEAWCNLKKSGAPPLSPKLALAAATSQYWNLRLKEVDIRDSSDDPLALEHLAAHIGLPLAEHHHHYDLSAHAQRKRRETCGG